MFHVPEKFRITTATNPMINSSEEDGNNGAFYIIKEYKELGGAVKREKRYFIIASDGYGWEHVSVHISILGKDQTPDWEDMCYVKDLFWDSEDCVIQFHQPKSQYINNHEHTLHLWRPTGTNIKTPPKELIGFDKLNIQK